MLSCLRGLFGDLINSSPTKGSAGICVFSSMHNCYRAFLSASLLSTVHTPNRPWNCEKPNASAPPDSQRDVTRYDESVTAITLLLHEERRIRIQRAASVVAAFMWRSTVVGTVTERECWAAVAGDGRTVPMGLYFLSNEKRSYLNHHSQGITAK